MGPALDVGTVPNRPSTSEVVADWLAAAVLPTMLLELMLPIASTTSLKVGLVFICASLVSGAGLRISFWLVAQLLVFSWYLATGLQVDGWFADPIVQVDIINALGAFLIVPFVAQIGWNPERRARLVQRIAALLVVGALAGGTMGFVKLFLLSRGVFIEQLYAADGSYPLGTALSSDYNLYAFGLVGGVAAAMFLLRRSQAVFVQVLLILTSTVLVSAIALTGSRRGLVFLGVVMLGEVVRSGSRTERVSSSARIFSLGLVFALAVGFTWLVARRQPVTVEIAGQQVDLSVVERLATLGERSSLVATRAPLVQWAWERVDASYSLVDLLVGRGFSYLGEMGRQFSAVNGAEYPHNFLLSAVLHGGVPLALLLIATSLLCAWRTYNTRDLLGPMAIIFVLAIVFAVTSSASLYSTEVAVFLLFLIPMLPQRTASPRSIPHEV